MDFTIEKRGETLLVRIGAAASDSQEVYEAVRACRGQSWWSCPSGECSKIGNCDTRQEGGDTVLAFTPRPGETLSATGVRECLGYVLNAARTDAGSAAAR